MRKLIQGILEFRRHVFPAYRMTFSRLAQGQAPDCLFIGCADSRVVPNLFASTQPGDLFVVRNVGNLVPAATPPLPASPESSVGAALEFAVLNLEVPDIVVCGHSGCGAMKGLLGGAVGNPTTPEHLAAWLANGAPALERLRAGAVPPLDGGGAALQEHDRLALVNVLLQVEHVLSHPPVRERVDAGRLRVHGWFFDIGSADVYAYEPALERFAVIDQVEAERILERLGPGT